MARRTIDKPTEEQAEQLPLPLPDATRRSWEPVRVVAFAALGILALAAIYFMFIWDPPAREVLPNPGATSGDTGEEPPPPVVAPSLPPAPPTLTYDELVALPPEEQSVEIDRMLRYYFDVSSVAARTFNPSLYEEVTTGDLLAYRVGEGWNEVAELRAEGRKIDGPPTEFQVRDAVVHKEFRILVVVIDGNVTWWEIDLSTGERIGDEKHESGRKMLNLREEAGRWKVFALDDVEP